MIPRSRKTARREGVRIHTSFSVSVPAGGILDLTVARGTPAVQADELLMLQIRAGDADAFQNLLRRYWEQLVAYAASIVELHDAAEDVVQEAFIRIWRLRNDWSPGGSVRSYLYTITRNLALNARRDRAVELKWRERSSRGKSPSGTPSTPADDYDVADLSADVNAAVAMLPARRREVFILSRFHGLTHGEIANTLCISPQTVANQMSAALEQLRVALSDHLQPR